MSGSAGASSIWMSSLAQLQRLSWDVGRPPLLNHWLNFFVSLRSRNTPQIFTEGPLGVVNNEHKMVTSHTSAAAAAVACTVPLPQEVRQVIAECFVDGARVAQLKNLLMSPTGILTDASSINICEGNDGVFSEGKRDFCGTTEKKCRECLSTSPGNAAPGADNHQCDFGEVLFLWCASHETPCHAQQLEAWLREAVGLLHFFTLRPGSKTEQLHIIRPQECLEYSSILCVLLRALCAMFLRSGLNATKGCVAGPTLSISFEEEVGLLSLWLLHSIRCLSVSSFTVLLQLVQMLLASGTKTRAWLLEVPSLLRYDGSGMKGHLNDDLSRKGPARLWDMWERSPTCRIARDIVPITPNPSSSPSLQQLFTDPHASVGTNVVLSLNEELSQIATSSMGG
ncbi:hypothetical protein DPX39_070017700 [Trypanosoma brucei equiperdum]|uniref:Uncharacterized protein n=1 Tax=Trypanosoma brucei equiperdum TaxID=630700 RepID=A0A3L6L3K6_9TRYP|nr:hypothetical protein DPX39_070017700 [Trypanosoma brucei equiperdum]